MKNGYHKQQYGFIRKKTKLLSPVIMNNYKAFLKFLLAFLVVVAVVNCGKKGPPVAPETLIPEAINDLRAEAKEDKIVLSWTIPQKNTNESILKDLAGFKVFRGEEACKGCPPDLSILQDIDYASPSGLATIEGKRVEFIDHQVKPKEKYIYRVFSYNRRGYLSSGSNLARIEVP
jgi:predicted small lipoprotein YifL